MRRVWSWLLRSKVLTNKEYSELLETAARLRKDTEFWNKAYADGHRLLVEALNSDVSARTQRLDEAQKNFEAALGGLRSEYDALYKVWTETRSVEEGLRKATQELESRVGPQPR